ncbi:hypothetical protein D3C81_1212870 [compost metagenome]
MPITNTSDIMPIIRPNTLSPSILATDEAMAKKTSGITLTKSRLRKISPIGFRLFTKCGKKTPIKLPIPMPRSSSRMLP